MITLLSPAKTLDLDSPPLIQSCSQPYFAYATSKLVNICKCLSEQDIQSLMGISPRLAHRTFQMFQDFQDKPDSKQTRPTIQIFKGEAYTSLHVEDFSQEDLYFAQNHFMIISGLYGLLQPLDLIQPYRLDMSTPLSIDNYKNLYQFWTSMVTERIHQILSTTPEQTIVNLASDEYSKAIAFDLLKAKTIKPIFLTKKGNSYKVISHYAKKCRGAMSRFIIKNKIDDFTDLQSFEWDGYRFNEKMSNEDHWAFITD